MIKKYLYILLITIFLCPPVYAIPPTMFATMSGGSAPGGTAPEMILFHDMELIDTTLRDASGNGHHGTLSGDPTQVTGHIGTYSLQFDGNDYVTMADSADFDFTTAFSVSAWVRRTGTLTGFNSFVHRQAEDGTNDNYYFFGADGHTFKATITTDAGALAFLESTTSMVLDTQYYFAFTWDGTTAKLYINNTLEDSAAHGGTFEANSQPILMGAETNSGATIANYFDDGELDQVRMYNYALTTGEMYYQYTEGPSDPPTTPEDGGTNYYFSTSGSDAANGLTPATAWQNPGVKLDGQTFANGTDFYFKQGDTFTVSNDIDIEHDGVDANNWAVFGCYEAEDDFNCSGSRPIIQWATATGGNSLFKLNNNNERLKFDGLDIRNTHANWQDSGTQGIGTPSDGEGGNGGVGLIVINNCRFYHWGHYAVGLARFGNYIIATNNVFDTNGNHFYIIDEAQDGPDFVLFEGNTCTDAVQYGSTDGHCAGLQRTDYAIVRNNTSDNSYAPYVIWSGSNTYTVNDNVIAYNTAVDTPSGGIYVFGATAGSSADSYHNLVYGNQIITNGTSSDREAIRLSGMKPTTLLGNRAFNNTVADANESAIGVKDDTDWTYWKNNIVHADDLAGKLFRWQDDGSAGDNLIIDYNMWWTTAGDPSASVLWEDSNDLSYNYANWKVRGNDTNGSCANPDFVSLATDDVTPDVGSPAINAGGYLTYVIGVSGTTINIADTYWFHGNYGLFDANGDTIDGMEITFYDETNGLQQRTITDEFILHTSYEITVNSTINFIYNAGATGDPAQTTQVSLKHYGTAPDIGAVQTE